jgi:hypothetical protein
LFPFTKKEIINVHVLWPRIYSTGHNDLWILITPLLSSNSSVNNSLSRSLYALFMFIFWWHQISSFAFFFSRLVLSTLQWYIHIICSRDKNYVKICCTPSYLSVRCVTNIKLFFAGK